MSGHFRVQEAGAGAVPAHAQPPPSQAVRGRVGSCVVCVRVSVSVRAGVRARNQVTTG